MDWVFREPPPIETKLRAAMRDWHRLDETEVDARIVAAAELPAEARDRTGITARRLVAAVRRTRIGGGGLGAFLHEYALSSQEGVALMCLAEALLRIPDAETIDKLNRPGFPGGRFV
jgi:RHH-type proline utilization regulon transcriptional repressor/proline dehydrogenase/delta 1-pyrroline-5-carboxylate dehydrogenase